MTHGEPDKIGKAGVGRPHETPDDAEHHQQEDGIADGLVHCLQVLGRPGEREEDDEGPMEDTHKWVPDLDGDRPLNAAGFRLLDRLDRHQLRPSRPMTSAVAGSTYISSQTPLLSVTLTS